MPSTITRRRALASGTAIGSVALAGCSGGCINFLSGMPHDGEIAAELTDAVPEQAAIMNVSELTSAEQSLIQTAIQDGVARVCMDDEGQQANALRSFSDQLPGNSAYLADDDDHYGLWLRIEDVVYVQTASAPEGNNNPCC